MLDGTTGDEEAVFVSLHTDSYVVRGSISTRYRRVTDILNEAGTEFVVLTEAVHDEYGSRAPAVRAAFAQVNLDAVLFAVADTPVEAASELSTPNASEQVMISIPPFRVVGHLHLSSAGDLRQPLGELGGRFVPVTDAAYWSETVGEARQVASIVAVNHARAQILAPHRELDPWEGLGGGEEGTAARAPDAIGDIPSGAASTSTAPGDQDPWRDVPGGGSTGAGNPWGGAGGDPWGAGRPTRDDELIG